VIATKPPIGGDLLPVMAVSTAPFSTLVLQFRDDRLEVPAAPADVFEIVIAGNDRVCQKCFRLLRRWERFPSEAGEDYGDLLAFVEYDLPEHQPYWNVTDREYYESLKEPDRLGRTHSPDGETSYCRTCGTMTPNRSPPTRSIDEARDTAVTLTVTLHEFGIEHDWVHLVERVQELKREPETAGDDFACFTRATAEAIEAVPDPDDQ
jgi:hypothetical protein